MNRKQKTCLLAGIAAIVVMGLFPPWVLESKEIIRLGNRWEVEFTLEPGPYSWIGAPPARVETKPNPYRTDDPKAQIGSPQATARFIDLYRLGLQFFVVAVVTAGLIIVLGGKKDRDKSPITFTWGLFFTLVSSIGLGFLVPTIIIGYCVATGEGTGAELVLVWFIVGLLVFAGIWILYGIIRWVIIPISRWVAKSFRDV
ncbi:MAG: hypothetical protein IIB56_20020 [Planctomycetes bacterium]|nr:hypothetical protein [Planctomycetota bacterium]